MSGIDILYKSSLEIEYVQNKVRLFYTKIDNEKEEIEVRDLYNAATLKTSMKLSVRSLKKLNKKYDSGT